IGSAIAINPGDHVFAARAPGRVDWSAKAHVDPGESITVDVPALAVATPAPAPLAPPAAPSEPPRARSRSRLPLALGLGGGGGVGLAIGAGFGLSAIAKWSSAKDDHCRGEQCDPDGLTLTHDATIAARTSTIAFAVGSVALLGGLLVWLTAPRSPARTAFRV